jgi:hypothetical protein
MPPAMTWVYGFRGANARKSQPLTAIALAAEKIRSRSMKRIVMKRA